MNIMLYLSVIGHNLIFLDFLAATGLVLVRFYYLVYTINIQLVLVSLTTKVTDFGKISA